MKTDYKMKLTLINYNENFSRHIVQTDLKEGHLLSFCMLFFYPFKAQMMLGKQFLKSSINVSNCNCMESTIK